MTKKTKVITDGYKARYGARPVTSESVACGARLSIRKFRITGDAEAKEAHEVCKAELAARGHTDQFGMFGWDEDYDGG